MKKLLLLVVLLAGLLVPARAGAAKPPAPACGALITSDIRLAQDMTCAASPALRVAPGVTVDLGRHTVTVPDDSGCSPAVLCPRAITVDEMFPSPFTAPITVKNGTLRGSVVRGHVIVDRVRFDGATSFAFGGSVTRSRLTASPLAVLATTTVDHNRFIDSPVSVDTALFGFGPGFAITNNRLDGSSISMAIGFGPGALAGEVSGNRIRNSSGVGLRLAFEVGAVDDLSIADNRVARNDGDGISVVRLDPLTGTGGHVTVTGNKTIRNGGAGIRVSDGTPPAVIDGGGNIARRNGEPCVGIVCSTNPSSL
jgi:hypothetical protein